jgi:hypothetical protein
VVHNRETEPWPEQEPCARPAPLACVRFGHVLGLEISWVLSERKWFSYEPGSYPAAWPPRAWLRAYETKMFGCLTLYYLTNLLRDIDWLDVPCMHPDFFSHAARASCTVAARPTGNARFCCINRARLGHAFCIARARLWRCSSQPITGRLHPRSLVGEKPGNQSAPLFFFYV